MATTVIKTPPVKLLFCKTDALVSKLIMWGTNSPVSHVAVDLPDDHMVVHSDVMGLHQMPRADFLAQHSLVATYTIWLDLLVEREVAKKFLAFVVSSPGPYDFGAFAYFAWRAGLSKVTGATIPKRNPWGQQGTYLCTEVAYLLNEALIEQIGRKLFSYDTELDAVAPWQLYKLLQQNSGGANEIDLRSINPGGTKLRT